MGDLDDTFVLPLHETFFTVWKVLTQITSITRACRRKISTKRRIIISPRKKEVCGRETRLVTLFLNVVEKKKENLKL